jgi:ABC-type multidrug transport system fused ATPase/permease subunit
MPEENLTDPLADLPRHLRVFQSYVGARMYLVFALTILGTLAESIGILLFLPLLQNVGGTQAEVEPGSLTYRVTETLSWLGLGDSIVALLILIAVFFFAKAVFVFVASAYKVYLNGQLLRELQRKMYDAYSRMSLNYYVSRDTGHFINVINTQVGMFVGAFQYLMALGATVLTTLVYLGVAMVVAWRFGVAAAILGLVILFAFRTLTAYVRSLSRKRTEEAGNLAKLLIQSLQAFKYLSATAQTQHIRKGAVRSIQRLSGYNIRSGVASAFTGAVYEPVVIVAILVIVILQLLWLDQSLAPIIVSILLFYRALGSVFRVQSHWQGFMSGVGAVEIVRDEFERQAQWREPDGTRELGPLSSAIELRDVHFAYGTAENPVLRGVSLTIRARTSVALVGRSGAGKSTLVDLLTLMLRPTRGQILIDGIPSEAIRLETWRRQIGYVSQETVVFDDTIANNICLWAGDVDTNPELFARVREAARQAHIAHLVEELPDGYQTRVGDRGVRLSGGQRQRLFIARELFRKPRLLILDEATSALDSDSELAIRESIDALRGQMTLVIIAHRLATIRNVDTIYVLDQGTIIESGRFEELRDDENSRFSRLVASQQL